MRKVITITLVLLLLFSCAVAEGIDLSGMSFDQLLDLKQEIILALWASDEWQEVTVPQGVWVVGKDIPAGKWTITALPTDHGIGCFEYGSSLDPNKNAIDRKTRRDLVYVKSETYKFGKDTDIHEYNIELKDGEYFIVSPDFGPVVFRPYSGPSFSFK